jgi:hypothetical protein
MKILGVFLAALAAILIFTGCETSAGYHIAAEVGTPPPPPPPPPPAQVVVVEKQHHGPPPHAPAHGYRRIHQEGHDLVLDESLGCYTVVGYRDYYFHDGSYFRFAGDGWEVSAHLGGADVHWVRAEERRVPAPLVVKYKGKGHDKRNDHDNGRGHDKDNGHGNNKHKDHGHSKSEETLPLPIKEARWGKY